MPEHLLIQNKLSPGDYVVMSAMVRDLHKAYPGRFVTSVYTPQPAVFQASPYNASYSKNTKVRTYKASYHKGEYSVHKSNTNRAHFMWGFIGDINLDLGLKVKLTEFKPDLHLTAEEMATPLIQKPYWVFVSGGKKDFTAKWWNPQSWTKVVGEMSKWVNVVQVGGGSHVHPAVEGAHDLRSKTSFRDLMRLIYHSEGVMCIVTCLMHIAAAFNKPCVTVGGGREAWWWEAYSTESRLLSMRLSDPSWNPPAVDNFVPHQYLHTIGELDCCTSGGCWASQVAPGVGKGKVCSKAAMQGGVRLPKCMEMITPEKVLQSVDWYYEKGFLSKAEKPTLILPPPGVLKSETPVDINPPAAKPQSARILRSVAARSPASPVPVPAECVLKTYSGTRQKALQDALVDAAHSGTDWLVWVEPSVVVSTSDWLDRLESRMAAQEVAYGSVTWKFLPGSSKADQKVFYLESGLKVLPASRLISSGFDATLFPEEDLDAAIGSALATLGVGMKTAGNLVTRL